MENIKIMSQFDIIMPKLGESVQEATITKWFKKEGDSILEDESLLEIATDKVDSEIPSPVAGVVLKLAYNEGDKIEVGKVIAIIETEASGEQDIHENIEKTSVDMLGNTNLIVEYEASSKEKSLKSNINSSFYSPLVKNIALKEGVSITELDKIKGSGNNNRVTKKDILSFLQSGRGNARNADTAAYKDTTKSYVQGHSGDKVVEMDRIRKLIAQHMVMSKNVSAHVTTFVEADVTNIVLWRAKAKDEFLKRAGANLTFLPIFIEATVKALKDFPMINVSVEGDNIIFHDHYNIGIAVSLPSGNLIVPVIKDADQRNLTGLALSLNKLAEDARNNRLSPDDIQGGTFTITNFGSFKNILGTPIINQPQVAILATGSIEKKPAVIETPTGDVIAIRHKMFLSLSYDHRVVDGALGGNFLRRIADYLEQFQLDREL
jgi:2-oxoglutarate dehydrogenase E2 component (dihydrolipoamide succinyltransferase)